MLIPEENRAKMKALRDGHTLDEYLDGVWARRRNEAPAYAPVDPEPEKTFAQGNWPNASRMWRRMTDAVTPIRKKR